MTVSFAGMNDPVVLIRRPSIICFGAHLKSFTAVVLRLSFVHGWLSKLLSLFGSLL